MTDFITTNLRLEIDATNQALKRWTDKQCDYLESSNSKFSQTMEEFECTLSALKENEAQLEDLRSKNNIVKMKQSDEIQSYMKQIEKNKQLKLSLRSQIVGIEEEETNELQRLNIVREEHEKARANAERSLDDLTHGIKMYMALGLEFQKTDGECMKFIFSNIDRLDHTKKFHFLMFVDSNDQYQLGKGKKGENGEEEPSTYPPLDQKYTQEALQALNRDNDIGKFVVSMRSAFQRNCDSSNVL